jgi:hypothetical protein
MFDRLVGFVELNAIFNNISVISWQPVLLVEKTGVSGENHRPVGSHWQTLSHIMLYTLPWLRFELISVMIGTDCICTCKFNYHAIMATTARTRYGVFSLSEWVSEWVSEWGLTPTQHLLSFIKEKTSTFLVRWWWGLPCTKPARLVRVV